MNLTIKEEELNNIIKSSFQGGRKQAINDMIKLLEDLLTAK